MAVRRITEAGANDALVGDIGTLLAFASRDADQRGPGDGLLEMIPDSDRFPVGSSQTWPAYRCLRERTSLDVSLSALLMTTLFPVVHSRLSALGPFGR